jgi:DNA-binding response OmpR family regulator
MDCLMLNHGQIVSSEALIDHIWGSWGGEMDMLRQLIHRLRHKIDTEIPGIIKINNIPGTGYELVMLQNGE